MEMFSVGAMGLLVFLGLAGGGGLPLGLPPGPEDPVVANAAPEECLFYLSWAGTATPDPKGENQLEQLLAEPEVQHLVAEVDRRIREGLKKAAAREGPDATALVDELADLVKKVLTSPAALYLGKLEIFGTRKIGERPQPVIQGGAIVGLGDDAAKVRATLEKYAKVLPPGVLQQVKVGGESFWSIQPAPDAPSFTWGVHGKHFVLGIGAGEAEAIVKRMSGKPPAWLGQVRQQLPVQRPSSVMYLNLNKIVGMIRAAAEEEAEPVIRGLGLDNFTSLASVSGLDKTGFVSKSLLGTAKEEADVLAFLGGSPLAAKDLAPIPKDATLALAARFDLDRVWEMVFRVMAKIDPGSAQEASEGIAMAERQLGLKLREDLFQTLGDVWCVYNSPGEGGLVLTGLTVVVPLKDPKRAAASHARILELMKQSIDEERGSPQGRRFAPRLDEHAFSGHKVYTFSAPDRDFPVAPSWCLTEKELIFALFPQQVKAYLSRGKDFQSLAAVPEVAELLQPGSGPIVVGYQDTPEMFRVVYPLVQMAAKLMTQELDREGVDVDVSLLPSAASIGKHLRPGVCGVRRTKAGIEITSRQSVPGESAAVALPMASFVAFFWFEERPVKRPVSVKAKSIRPIEKTEAAPEPELKPEPPPAIPKAPPEPRGAYVPPAPVAPQQLDAQTTAQIKQLGGKSLAKGFKASWSPDGKRLAFSKLPIGAGISVLETGSGKLTDLAGPGKDPAWSPKDGRLIAYVRGSQAEEEVWVVEAAGGTPRKVADGGFPSWSADGKTLLFHSRAKNKLMRLEWTDASAPAAAADVQDVPWWYPAVSGDGKKIAYRSGDQLIVADLRNGGMTYAWRFPGGQGFLGGWSPDGTQLGFGGWGGLDNQGLWLLNLQARSLLRVAAGQATMPAWSPDGSKLAVDLRLSGGWEVWMLEAKALQQARLPAASALPTPVPVPAAPAPASERKPLELEKSR